MSAIKTVTAEQKERNDKEKELRKVLKLHPEFGSEEKIDELKGKMNLIDRINELS